MKTTLLLTLSPLLSWTTSADEPLNIHNMGKFVRQRKLEYHANSSQIQRELAVVQDEVIFLDARIINGTETPVDGYPYLAALYAKEYYGTEHAWCGGTLIAPSVVLTAAHCITDSKVDEVVLGMHDMTNYDDITERNSDSVEFHTIQRSVVHPSYGVLHSHTLYMDFGLLFLDKPSNLPPIKFLNVDPARPVVGEVVTAAGWGLTDVDDWQFANVTMEVELDIISAKTCLEYYNDYFLPECMVCAYRQNMDACQGDSGGPLIGKQLNSSEDILYGVISWGYSCATENPGVYATLSSAHDWIVSQIAEYNVTAEQRTPH